MQPPGRRLQSLRWRIAAFTAVCVVCMAVSVGYVRHAAGRESRSRRAAAASIDTSGDPAAIGRQPRLLFQSPPGSVAMVARADPGGARALTGLDCDRVDFVDGLGVCLTPTRGLLAPAEALVFDSSFTVRHRLRVPGLPSRVRLSPDGRWAAATTFVKGHSYAEGSFSTRTVFLDVERGKVAEDAEAFTVRREGERFHNIDFNFWGVTFAQDSNRFYATLGTGDHRYLVEGDLRARMMTVLRNDVECPSLSPDNRRIAFKRRVPNPVGPVTWRLSVLDLATLQETPLAETANVDDQAAWLDDERVLYGLRGTSRAADTWVVPADGTGTPRMLVPNAWSPAVVQR